MMKYFSSDNGRLHITRTGTRCDVLVENAMPRDSGKWEFLIGTGDDLSVLQQTRYIYDVIVDGKYVVIDCTIYNLKEYIIMKN